MGNIGVRQLLAPEYYPPHVDEELYEDDEAEAPMEDVKPASLRLETRTKEPEKRRGLFGRRKAGK